MLDERQPDLRIAIVSLCVLQPRKFSEKDHSSVFKNVRQLLKTLAIPVGVFQVSFSWVKELKSIYYTIWEALPAICWNWKAPVLADLFQSFS